VIGPVDYQFTQTTLQLVSEDSSGSVLLGRSALLATNSRVKFKETPFVRESRLLMELSQN